VVAPVADGSVTAGAHHDDPAVLLLDAALTLVAYCPAMLW